MLAIIETHFARTTGLVMRDKQRANMRGFVAQPVHTRNFTHFHARIRPTPKAGYEKQDK